MTIIENLNIDNLPNSYDQWIKVIEELKQKLGKDIDLNELAKTLMFAADHLKSLNKYEDSRKILQEALKYTEETDNKALTADILVELSKIYQIEQDFDDAYQFQEQALKLYKDTYGEISEQVAAAYNNLAIIVTNLGYYELAEKFLNKHLEISEKLNLPEEFKVASLINMAGIVQFLGKNHKALDLLREAQLILEKQEPVNKQLLAKIYNNQALVNSELEHYDLALTLLDKAIEIFEENPEVNTNILYVAYYNKAETLYKKGDKLEAIKFLDKSIDIYKRLYPMNTNEINELEQTRENWTNELKL